MIDLDGIESRINDGIYGIAQQSDADRDDAFSALAALIAEVERLRGINADLRLMVDGLETAAHEERAAVVAWLREGITQLGQQTRLVSLGPLLLDMVGVIERGEHRREEEK